MDHNLACNDCFEFTDLHKWPIDEEAGHVLVKAHYQVSGYAAKLYAEQSGYQFLDANTLSKKVIVSSESIRAAAEKTDLDHDYIKELKPIILEFTDKHRGHNLFLCCDMGCASEHPWSLHNPDFHHWRQVSGPFNDEHYLPRNLIELFGAKEWPNLYEKPYSDHIDADWLDGEDMAKLKAAFEKRITNG